MSTRFVRIVALVVALAMVLTGLGIAIASFSGGGAGGSGESRKRTWEPAPSSSPAPGADEPPSAALAPYYSQELDWQRCREAFECATLTVPLDYRDPDGDTLGIALLRRPADEPGQRIGSLVVNPGGPGAPGTTYAEQASAQFGDPLLARYDLVGFDPRGTGESSPVDCLGDAELNDYLAADPLPDSPQEVAELVDGVRRMGRGCAERSGDVAAHVSTIEAARDMDVLRAALGEAELTYFGASYGTKLGATYAELFPDRVGRFVLDGAVDVTMTALESALGQAGGFETALRAYVDHCVEGGDCVLGGTVDDALARLVAFLDEVDREPLPTRDGRQLRAGDALLGIITPLYVSDYWSLLDQGLQQAFDGDGSVLMLLADAYASRQPDGSFTNNGMEAIVAINCLDDPESLPVEQVPSYYDEFERVAPTLGRIFAWGLVGCVDYPLKSSERPLRIDGAGAAPIVVTGTTRDPATPYAWAQALAKQLESAVLVTRDGDGHTAYGSGNACVDDALEAYLVDGEVPRDGLRC